MSRDSRQFLTKKYFIRRINNDTGKQSNNDDGERACENRNTHRTRNQIDGKTKQVACSLYRKKGTNQL